VASWSPPDTCGNCGRELPERGWHRRRVPRRSGRKLRVCAECTSAIDKQGTLELEPPPRQDEGVIPF
jgi:hypothetical protein